MAAESDLAAILPAIRVPTLVLHRSGDPLVPVNNGRYLGAHIPGAQYIELAGDDHLPWVGEYETLVLPIESFLGDVGRDDVSEPDRALTTVLFVDIVGSTQKAVELGDSGWRELLERYRALIRRQLVRYRGRELDTAGEGVFASFDGPARAIRCACSVSDETRAIGVEVRIGLHTGECEFIDGKLGGIVVDTGARIGAEAGPGEVLVSSTLKDSSQAPTSRSANEQSPRSQAHRVHGSCSPSTGQPHWPTGFRAHECRPRSISGINCAEPAVDRLTRWGRPRPLVPLHSTATGGGALTSGRFV